MVRELKCAKDSPQGSYRACLCDTDDPATYRERVLIRRCETGLSLPHAPEFGPDGAWPPVVTQWVPLSWALFWTEHALWEDRSDLDPDALAPAAILQIYSPRPAVGDALRTEDALRDDFLHESLLAWFPQETVFHPMGAGGARLRDGNFLLYKGRDDREGIAIYTEPPGELRRAVRSVRWRRKDPVTQLPPGVTHEMTQSVTTGLSVEHSRTLADSLGFDLGGEAAGVQAKLSSQAQEQLGLKLDITSQQQHSTKLTLCNSSEDRYRLFALWHVDHRISVDALTLPADNPGARKPVFGSHSHGFRPAWQPRESVEFAAENDSHITYVEVSRVLLP